MDGEFDRAQIGQQKNSRDFRKTHDTPPPITFENGSFVLERKGEFLPGDIVANATAKRLEHSIRPLSGHTTAVPEHIKIIDGSGELLYRNNDAATCIITIELKADNAVVNAKASDDQKKFVIDTELDKSFVLGDHGKNDKPTSKKRDRRYRHSKDTEMKEVTVKDKADKILFRVELKNLPDDGADLRIMVWLE